MAYLGPPMANLWPSIIIKEIFTTWWLLQSGPLLVNLDQNRSPMANLRLILVKMIHLVANFWSSMVSFGPQMATLDLVMACFVLPIANFRSPISSLRPGLGHSIAIWDFQ